MRKSFILFLAVFIAFLIFGCYGNKLTSPKAQYTILVSDTI
jgi:hypothetical protein